MTTYKSEGQILWLREVATLVPLLTLLAAGVVALRIFNFADWNIPVATELLNHLNFVSVIITTCAFLLSATVAVGFFIIMFRKPLSERVSKFDYMLSVSIVMFSLFMPLYQFLLILAISIYRGVLKMIYEKQSLKWPKNKFQYVQTLANDLKLIPISLILFLVFPSGLVSSGTVQIGNSANHSFYLIGAESIVMLSDDKLETEIYPLSQLTRVTVDKNKPSILNTSAASHIVTWIIRR